jgi:hypothetical protein
MVTVLRPDEDKKNDDLRNGGRREKEARACQVRDKLGFIKA